MWQSAGQAAAGFGGFGKPAGETTDLASPLAAVLGSDRGKEEKGAIVLFSDGQHNEGDSPLEASKVLGARQLPIFTIGYGATTRPHDLAVTRIQAPQTVFSEDTVHGSGDAEGRHAAGSAVYPFRDRWRPHRLGAKAGDHGQQSAHGAVRFPDQPGSAGAGEKGSARACRWPASRWS